MTEEKIRIAIAESVGRVRRPDGYWYAEGKLYGSQGIPDYCHDLNAMHDAEMTLAEDPIFHNYEAQLDRVVPMSQRWIFATARQRAEAYLKTIGRWQD